MSLRGRQLFVGNLPFIVGWQDLKDLFRGAGNVQRANIIQGRDGRSKGHGIVLFATIEDAKRAIEMFDKYDWHGRILEVREDRNLPDYTHTPYPASVPEPVTASAAIAASSEDVDKLVDAVEKNLKIADAASTSAEDNKSNRAPSSTSTPAVGLETGANTDSLTKEGGDGAAALTTPTVTSPVRPVYVGNIPFRMRWQDLKDLFRKAGHVVRAEIALNHDRRSRGYGTVLFSTQEEADKAVSMFDQYQWQDRILRVQEDRMYQHDGGGHGYSNDGPGFNQGFRPNYLHHGPPGHFFRGPPPVNQNLIGRQVFVGNLPFMCQWQDLKDLFRKAGNIIRADVAHDYNGRSRGFGSVLFATQDDAKKAIEMFDSYEYNGRRLRVHLDKFTSMSHGHPPMPGGVGPHMMHPNGPPPHGHPHPHHHPHHHRLHHHHHPMHPQPHGPGFLGTFGPPGMMNLGPHHPMVPHSGSPQGQFGMPPLPQFAGGRPYSPPMMMHGPTGSGPDFMGGSGGADNFHRSNDGMPPMNDDMVKSPPPFDPTSGGSVSVSAEAHGVGATSGPAVSGSGGIPTHPGSPSSQQYPFMPTNLGPIGKPNLSNGSGAGGAGSAGLGANGATANGTGDETGPHVDYPPVNAYGVDVPFDADGAGAYSPHFYMYPSLLPNSSSQPNHHHGYQQQQNVQTGQGQQGQQQQQPSSSQPQGQVPPPGVTAGPGGPSPTVPFHQQRGSVYSGSGGPYQDPYSPDPTSLSQQPFSGSIGALPSATTPGAGVTSASVRGYPSQPDWMGPPAPFGGMGHYHHPHHHHPQPMYGSPSAFAPYGQGNGGVGHGNQDSSEFAES